MKPSTLSIVGIECWSYHGCMREETKIGGQFFPQNLESARAMDSAARSIAVRFESKTGGLFHQAVGWRGSRIQF